MGILANSPSVTMTTSTSDDVRSGFILNEQVTLSLSVSGTTFLWSQSIPNAAGPSRAALDSYTSATPKFTPPAAGVYVLTCLKDGTTTYVLRISVTATASVTVDQVVRLSPVADTQVPTPALGVSLYFSSTQGALVVKDTTGAVKTVDLTVVP